ncbi:Mitochondrial PGP phosphatase [Naviculisporaceae sp. PSN 640]
MNLNLSASLNIFKLIAKPSLCLPHATVATFDDLPVPLDTAFSRPDRKVDIRAVVLDKDDCFAWPEKNEVYDKYKVAYCLFPMPLSDLPILSICYCLQRFAALRAAYPGRRLLIVSNTAGATSYDVSGKLATEVEKATGVTVLPHQTKKPGCGQEIMSYFREHPETGVTHPAQIAIVGDRLATDMMLANMMGSYGVWVKDGVVPHQQKSIFSRVERKIAPFLTSRGYSAPDPVSPFE